MKNRMFFHYINSLDSQTRKTMGTRSQETGFTLSIYARCHGVGSKSHCRAVPAVPSPIWCASNLLFIISSKLAYEVKNCNDIMFLC